jgi:hypothetical protein
MGLTDGSWDRTFLNAIEQACESAVQKAFGKINDEKIRQALGQGFAAGVEWCFSPQFDADVAQATLAVGVTADEAASGAVRKIG